jgi:hypothetical protein
VLPFVPLTLLRVDAARSDLPHAIASCEHHSGSAHPTRRLVGDVINDLSVSPSKPHQPTFLPRPPLNHLAGAGHRL